MEQLKSIKKELGLEKDDKVPNAASCVGGGLRRTWQHAAIIASAAGMPAVCASHAQTPPMRSHALSTHYTLAHCRTRS